MECYCVCLAYGTTFDFKWIWAGGAGMLGNSDNLLTAVVEKLEWTYNSKFSTFSTVGVNDILLGWGGTVGLVHGGMLGALDSEICSMVDFFCGGHWILKQCW